jgi:hypothetical protein
MCSGQRRGMFLCSHKLQKRISQQFVAAWPSLTTVWPLKMWVSKLPECWSMVVMRTRMFNLETCDATLFLRWERRAKVSPAVLGPGSAMPSFPEANCSLHYFISSSHKSCQTVVSFNKSWLLFLVRCTFYSILLFSEKETFNWILLHTEYLKSLTFDLIVRKTIMSEMLPFLVWFCPK